MLVVGKESREQFQEGLEWDAEAFKWGLTKNPKGPRLPESSVVTLNQPHPDTLCDLMASMQGKYKKIYFYYTGHGDTTLNEEGEVSIGWMCIDSLWMSYRRLMSCLYDIGAKDICISIDACFAGSIECFVKNDDRYKNHNIEIIASSSKTKTSFFGYVVEENGDTARYSTFSRNFAFCSVDPAADADDDGSITRCEAFDWVKTRGDDDQWGRSLDSMTMYKKVTFAAEEVETASTEHVSLEGTDIEFEVEDTYSATMTIEIEAQYDWVDTEEEVGDSVFSVSTNRMWRMSITPNEWDADMTVHLNGNADNVPTDAGVMGVTHRTDESEEWVPMYPSIYNSDAGTVTVTEPRTGDYQMRIGDVIERLPTSVEESVEQVQAFPNPVQSVLHIPFEIESSGEYTVRIVSASGNTVSKDEHIALHAGNNTLSIDVAAYSAGVYFVEFSHRGHTITTKFVKH